MCKKRKQEKCGYKSIEECPYNSLSDCPKRIANCVRRLNKPKKKRDNVTIIILLVLALGLAIYVIAAKSLADKTDTFWTVLANIGEGVSVSLIAGAILALLVDIPAKLKDYKESIIDALTSNKFIRSLDEDRLEKLRNDVTIQLHNAPNMAKELVNVDKEMCNLLRKPYYQYYRQNVSCEIPDHDFYKKDVVIEYKVINPYGVGRPCDERIRMQNLVLLNGKQPGEILTDVVIECMVDEKDPICFSGDQIHVLSNSVNKKYEYYDARIFISDKEGDLCENAGFTVRYDNQIIVKIQYSIVVPVEDVSFTKRLQRPTQSFRLDYYVKDSNVKLYGQIFGTEFKQSNMSIQYQGDNNISLEAHDWLLPSNGAIVVMCKK